MENLLKPLYFSLVKPFSHYISDPNPDYRKRIVNLEVGECGGVGYRLEEVVSNGRNPFNPDHVSRRTIMNSIKKHGYNIGANLNDMFAAQQERKESGLLKFLTSFTSEGIINNILTRPAYDEEGTIYLILNGLSQEAPIGTKPEKLRRGGCWQYWNEEEVHLDGTHYQVFLRGLAEERFRKLAEIKVKEEEVCEIDKRSFKTRGNSDGTFCRLELSVEDWMKSMSGAPPGCKPYQDYYFVDGKIVPVLSVNSFEHGHEAAQSCIDFALGEGQKILNDELYLLKYSHIYRQSKRYRIYLQNNITSEGILQDEIEAREIEALYGEL